MKKNELFEAMGAVDDEMLQEAMRPWKKEKAGRSWQRYLKAACVLLAVTATTAAFQPDVRAALQELTTRFAALWGVEKDYGQYAKSWDGEQTDDGITIQLQEVILADQRIYAAVAMDAWEEGMELWPQELRVNGNESAVTQGMRVYKLEEDSYVVEYDLRYPASDRMETLGLEYLVYDSLEELDKEARASFSFEVPVDGIQAAKPAVEMELAQEIGFGEQAVLKLTNLTLNELYSEIAFETVNFPKESASYILEGEDSLGNPVLYEVFWTPEDEPDPTVWKTAPVFDATPTTVPDPEAEWMELQLSMIQYDAADDAQAESEASKVQKKEILGEPFRISFDNNEA